MRGRDRVRCTQSQQHFYRTNALTVIWKNTPSFVRVCTFGRIGNDGYVIMSNDMVIRRRLSKNIVVIKTDNDNA